MNDKDTVVRLDLDKSSASHRATTDNLLADRFGPDADKRKAAAALLAEMPVDAADRDAAWNASGRSPVHKPLEEEWKAKHVKTADRDSPYLWRHVGEKPAKGWALVIAMHGGGGAPRAVNDGQWKECLERYYRPHPEAGGYVSPCVHPTTSGTAFTTTRSARSSSA
ncbi:MAG: hypothetical protein U0794_16120 [Isosphaeraceae bacterium]